MSHHKFNPLLDLKERAELLRSNDQHMTVSQLARRLGVTTDYLRRELLAQPGGIPGFKIGRGPRSQWRIRLCDVTRWEESRMVSYDFTAQPNTQKTGR